MPLHLTETPGYMSCRDAEGKCTFRGAVALSEVLAGDDPSVFTDLMEGSGTTQ